MSRGRTSYRQTLVKRGATLGANATIVCGHTIGAYAFVGAGAVVTRDVPDYALMSASPARVTGWVCACGVKLAAGARPPDRADLRRRAARNIAAARCIGAGGAREP